MSQEFVRELALLDAATYERGSDVQRPGPRMCSTACSYGAMRPCWTRAAVRGESRSAC
jgi:hypothetical protein